ncbi:ATP-binding protein [Pseudomonas chlororaphis]|uniref:ATP-binding protein n=1 Tax=Pseudomonas chlororaphis TaxID=587753 RepID=UPI0009C06DDD|nr:transporter substrate-binding domain-containing protein [Pseudomonas chlororaphis]
MPRHPFFISHWARCVNRQWLLSWRSLLLVCVLYPFLSQPAKALEAPQLDPQADLPYVRLVLAAHESTWLQSRHVIRLGVTVHDYSPLFLPQGQKIKGVMADYLSIIAQSLGLSVEVKVYSGWSNALNGLRSGEVDVLGLGSSYEAQLPGLLLSSPYTANQPILVGRDDEAASAPSPRLAAVEGYASPAELQARFPDAQIQVYSSVREALYAVEYKRADWAVCDAATAAHHIGVNELASLRMRPLNLPATGYSFVFREADALLLGLFNRVIADIPLGAQTNIRAYWGGGVYFNDTQKPLYNPEQLSWLATHPQIQVVASGGTPPYSYFDEGSNYRGLVADLLREISLRSGLRFNVAERSTDQEVMDALQTGKAQLTPHFLMTPEHEGFLRFTEPFGASTFALVGARGSAISRLDDLRGKQVSLTQGSPVIPFLRQNYPDIVFVEKESPLESLQAVDSGLVEAAVVLLPIARSLINQQFAQSLSVLTSLPALRANLTFAVIRDSSPLFAVIETTLARIEPRMMGSLLERWQDSQPDQEDLWGSQKWRQRWTALGAGAAIGMLMMWFFYSVYRRLKVRAEQGRQVFRSALLDGLPQPVVVRDINGAFLLCNDAFYSVFGLQPSDVLGRKWKEVNGLEGVQTIDEEQTYNALLQTNEADVRLVNFTINGVARSYRQWAVPHKETNGRRSIGLLMGWIDMSDTERLLQQLYAVRDQAVQASEAKSRFLTAMSHEIRTPLNVIIGLLELTLARVDKGEDWDRPAIEVAHSTSSALMFLIGEILDLSKIESGKLILEPQRNNPKEIVETVERVFREVARQKGLYLRLELQVESDKDALIDGARLKQVLFNLLSNAIKFTDHGGVKISLRVREIEAELGMEFILEDTGIGISAENQKLLFQPFSQVRGPASNRGGTGLGLVICQQLVELMKGHLELTSTPQQGTRVTVTLSAPALEMSAPEPGEGKPANPRSALRVLVVDDHPANRLLLCQQLTFLGHTIHEAEEGLQAFELIKVNMFDVIITDCDMPVMDGYELTHLIRQDEHDKKRVASLVIGYTANAQASERQRCLAAGMNDCLFKPVSLDMLKACLSDVLVDNHPAPVCPVSATPLAVFDLAIFNSLTGSDPHLERLLLESLHSTNCLDLKQFDELLSASQWYELGRLVHRIKGAARIVGAQVVVEAAEAYAQHRYDELSEEETLNSAAQVRTAIIQLQEAVSDRLTI